MRTAVTMDSSWRPVLTSAPGKSIALSGLLLLLLPHTACNAQEYPAIAKRGVLHTTGSITIGKPAPPRATRPANANTAPRSASLAPRLRGLIVPRRQANISAAIAATITSIGPDNGDRFRSGDTLVAFDCGIYNAELNRARAVADAAADTFTVKRKLAASGSVSRLQALLANSELKKARAEVVVAEAKVADCKITAPFDGRVIRRIANAFETVSPRDPLIEIVDDAGLEIRVFVPSSWVQWLKPGARFQFKIDESGATVNATVIALGAAIDNVSQLIELRASIAPPAPSNAGENDPPPLLAGMSGNAVFPDAPGAGQQLTGFTHSPLAAAGGQP